MMELLSRFTGKTWYHKDEIEQEFLDFGFPLEKQQIINACNDSGGDGEKYYKIIYE